MKRRVPSVIIAKLREAREAATFERASFAYSEKENADIKEKTRVYRQTWVISRIDAVLEWMEGNGNSRDLRW